MGYKTKIGWVRNSDGSQGSTFNPWIGCTKISPGCDFCYAERERCTTVLGIKWGVGEKRHRTAPSTWKNPIKWNRQAAKKGIRIRVFCASLADVFDNEVPAYWRRDLFQLIHDTPNLDWILLTKRIGNVDKMLPADWGDGYPNVWLVITVVNQEEVDRDFLKLAAIPATIRGLSIEPQLEPIELSLIGTMPKSITGSAYRLVYQYFDWIISGAESGPEARPYKTDWARDLRDQCADFEVPFFFKQAPGEGRKGVIELPLLDGRTHEEMPG